MTAARALVVAMLLIPACTGYALPPAAGPGQQSRGPTPGDTTPTPGEPTSTSSGPPPARAEVDPVEMLATVQALAAFGPREATTAAYRRAAALVRDRFEQLGLDVVRVRVRVPAGVSWGVRVGGGDTFNVVAQPQGFDPSQPHLVIGAHLDTVPQSPGANDNASGVTVMLELARLASLEPPRVPVVFVAFGAEEPRGPGDDDHHYGSRAYVRALEADAPLAMISLDRVGIGRRVRVCTGGLGPRSLARFIRERGHDARIATDACRNRASDHWSFEKGGFPAVRLLGADDPAYHTPADLPRVVRRMQLERIARLAWETMRALAAGDVRP